MIYIFWVLSIVFVFIFLKQRQKNRIEEIIDLINRLELNNYKIPMKQDDFSILEDEIYKLFVELVEEREKNKSLLKNQSKNIEDIAHQIKTPITGMIFSLENGSSEKEIISKNLNRLNELSNSLLKLSSFDANADNMKKDEVYLREVIDYSLDILSEDTFSREIIVINNVREEIIYANFYWICEAFINIIKNSISIDRTTEIEINSKDNPIYTEVRIKDNGGGINESIKKNIFKRFYKDPDSNGFGIGLAMAREIILKHNGTIEAINTENGAEFIIKFYIVT